MKKSGQYFCCKEQINQRCSEQCLGCFQFEHREMRTPMQQVYAHLRASKESDGFGEAYCVDWLLEMEESMLEREKEAMCNFAKKWDMEFNTKE